MELDEKLVTLIQELEKIFRIQINIYNPDKKHTPLWASSNKKDFENGILRQITDSKIDPEYIFTMQYILGSIRDRFYIGNALVDILTFLEGYYLIDFNELEEQRMTRRINAMKLRETKLKAKETIKLPYGCYVIGVDLPEGKYLFSRYQKKPFGVRIEDAYVNPKNYNSYKFIRSLKNGYLLYIYGECNIKLQIQKPKFIINNELSDNDIEDRQLHMHKRKYLLEQGNSINVENCTWIIGIDIPEGTYEICRSSDEYSFVRVYNTRGTLKFIPSGKQKSTITVIRGYKMIFHGNYTIRMKSEIEE